MRNGRIGVPAYRHRSSVSQTTTLTSRSRERQLRSGDLDLAAAIAARTAEIRASRKASIIDSAQYNVALMHRAVVQTPCIETTAYRLLVVRTLPIEDMKHGVTETARCQAQLIEASCCIRPHPLQ